MLFKPYSNYLQRLKFTTENCNKPVPLRRFRHYSNYLNKIKYKTLNCGKPGINCLLTKRQTVL